jgi:hypothetical protein
MDPCPRCKKELPADADRCEACGLDISAVRIAVDWAVQRLREEDEPDVDDISYQPPSLFSRPLPFLRRTGLWLGAVSSLCSSIMWFFYALWLTLTYFAGDWPEEVNHWYDMVPLPILIALLATLASYGVYSVFRICIRIAEQEE